MSKDIGFKNRDRFIQLGITISVLRKMRGMSQEQLAAKAEMSRSHLSAIEAPNIVRSFSVELLFNIADGFVGNSVDTAFQTVGSVFLRTAFRDINGVFRFFFGLDKGGFHTLGGNRRFINRFDRAFQSIPCLNIRHRKPPFQAPVDALK